VRRRRSRPGATLLALAAVTVCALAFSGRALALPGDPTPSAGPTATPKAELVDFSGHWETNGFGGMDLVQQGTAVRGTSPAGVSFEGTLSGRRVNFRFWHGASYAKADEENRGRGSMTLSADGRTLTVTWETEEKPSPYNGSFTAIRVGPQVPMGPTGSKPTAAPSPRPSSRPSMDQLWGPGGLGPWLAVFFGLDTSQIIGKTQPGGLYDQEDARARFATVLIFLTMAVEHGPDWLKRFGSLEKEWWEVAYSISVSLEVPFVDPQATQPPWWPAFQDADFPWDEVNPPPTTSPLVNPASSGNPLVNPASSGNPLVNPASSGNPLQNP
jgi:hypothetical protein